MDHKEAIRQTHNRIAVIMGDLHHQITDILHQELQLTILKDLEVPQVLVSIHTLLLAAVIRQVHLLQEGLLTHILRLLVTRTQEIPLLILIAITLPQLVEITLHHLSLVLLLDIPLNQYPLHLKTRMYHQIHQIYHQEGQAIQPQIHTLLR